MRTDFFCIALSGQEDQVREREMTMKMFQDFSSPNRLVIYNCSVAYLKLNNIIFAYLKLNNIMVCQST